MSSNLIKDGTDLIIKDGGYKYKLEGTELKKIIPEIPAVGGNPAVPATTAAVKAADAKNIISRTIRNVEDNAVEADVLEMLKADTTMDGFRALNNETSTLKRINKLQDAAKIANEIKSKATGTLSEPLEKELRGLIVQGGDKALNLLKDDTHTFLDGMNQKELRKVQSAYDALHEAAADSSATKSSIKSVVTKHREYATEAMEILGKAEDRSFFTTINKAIDGSLKDVPTDVLEKIEKRSGKIKDKLTAHESAFNDLRKLEVKKGAKVADIDAAQEAVNKLEKEFITLTEDSTGKASVKDLLKDDATKKIFDKIKMNSTAVSDHLETIKSTAKDVTTTAGKAGSTAGKAATGIFYKSEAAQKILAKEKGIAVDALSLGQKLHGGKVAGAIAAAGIVAYVAGVGKKGKAAEMNQEQQGALLQQQGEGQVAAR